MTPSYRDTDRQNERSGKSEMREGEIERKK